MGESEKIPKQIAKFVGVALAQSKPADRYHKYGIFT
jgi:hypothetical protein